MEQSASITNLAAALVAAHAALSNVAKTADNPFFKSKYTPLDALIDHAKPVLAQHKLAVVQWVSSADSAAAVTTMLLHESGEWMAERAEIAVSKADPQAYGSAISYQRRYSYAAVLGIASEDDDANAASGKSKTAPADTPPVSLEPEFGSDGTTKHSVKTAKRFFALLKENGVDAEKGKQHLKTRHELASFNDATEQQLQEAITALSNNLKG
jgi:hypothetical protein